MQLRQQVGFLVGLPPEHPLERPDARVRVVDAAAGRVEQRRAVGGKLVVSFPVSDGARDASGVWDPDQARRLNAYTKKLGGYIYAAELINEPNAGSMVGLPKGYDAAAFARVMGHPDVVPGTALPVRGSASVGARPMTCSKASASCALRAPSTAITREDGSTGTPPHVSTT